MEKRGGWGCNQIRKKNHTFFSLTTLPLMDQRSVNMVSPQQLDIGEILTYAIFGCRDDAMTSYYGSRELVLIWVRPPTGDSVHIVPAIAFTDGTKKTFDDRIRKFFLSDSVIPADLLRIRPMFDGYSIGSNMQGLSFVPAMFPELMKQTRERRRITEVMGAYNIEGGYGIAVVLRLSYLKFYVLVPLAWLVLEYTHPNKQGPRMLLYDTAVATYIENSAPYLAPHFSNCVPVGGIGVKLETDFPMLDGQRVDELDSPITGADPDQAFSSRTGINITNVFTACGVGFRVCASLAEVEQVAKSANGGMRCTPCERRADCVEVDYVERVQLVRAATRRGSDEIEQFSIACLVKDDNMYFARLDIRESYEIDSMLFPHVSVRGKCAVLGLGIPINNKFPGMWDGRMQSSFADMRARYAGFVAPVVASPAPSVIAGLWAIPAPAPAPAPTPAQASAAAAQAQQAAAEQAQQVAAQQAAAAQAQQIAAQQAAAAQAQHAAAAPVAPVSYAVPVVQAPTTPAPQRVVATPVAVATPAQIVDIPVDDDDDDDDIDVRVDDDPTARELSLAMIELKRKRLLLEEQALKGKMKLHLLMQKKERATFGGGGGPQRVGAGGVEKQWKKGETGVKTPHGKKGKEPISSQFVVSDLEDTSVT